MRRFITTCAVALSAVVPSPATAQNREHQQQAAELRILQEQQVQLALALAQIAQSLAETTKALNSRLDQTNERIAKGFADQGLGIKSIENNIGIIRQNGQETSTRLGELKNEIEALRRDLTSMMSRMLTAAPPAPVDPLDPNAPAPTAPVATAPVVTLPPSTIGLSPQVVYQTAYADYTSGQFESAVEGFKDYLRNFPTFERAAAAQYHIGEAEYSRNRFDEAIAAYNLVIQKYPNGNQVSTAYYKLGVAHERLQRYDSARAAWQQLLKQFPNSAEAGLATQSLRRIERAQGTQKP